MFSPGNKLIKAVEKRKVHKGLRYEAACNVISKCQAVIKHRNHFIQVVLIALSVIVRLSASTTDRLILRSDKGTFAAPLCCFEFPRIWQCFCLSAQS